MTLHEGSLIAADEETISGSSAAPLSPLVSMLGFPAGAEIDVLVDGNADKYWERSEHFDMAIDLTAGRRGLAALGEAMSYWVRHMLSVEVEIEPLCELREVDFTWYVGLDAEATRIGNALWNGEALDEKSRSAVVGLYRLTFAGTAMPPGACRRTDQRRSGLSHPGDVTGQGVAHEAAKSPDRPAGPPSGGGELSAVRPHACVPVGVVVERRKATSPWLDSVWRSVAVLCGVPDAAPWTVLAAAEDAATFYIGAAEIELYRTETDHYRGNLASGAPSVWVALRPTGACPPYDLFAVTADPSEGESFTQAGDDLVDAVPMPAAVQQIVEAFVAEHHVERADLQAQARPRRSASAGAPRSRAKGPAKNEQSGKLPHALVAPQARGGCSNARRPYPP